MAVTPEELEMKKLQKEEREHHLRQHAFSVAQSQKKENEDILVLAEKYYKFLAGK